MVIEVQELELGDLEVGDGEPLNPLEVSTLDDDEDAQWNRLANTAKEPFLEVRPIRVGDLLEVMSPSYRKAKVLKVQRLSCIVQCRVMVNEMQWGPEKDARPRDNWKPLVWNEVWAVRTWRFPHHLQPNVTVTERHCLVTQENRPKAKAESSIATNTIIQVVRDERPNRFWRVPEEAQPKEGKANAQVNPRQEAEREAPPAVPAHSPVVAGGGQEQGSGIRGGDQPSQEVPEEKAQAPKPLNFKQAVKAAKDAGINISDISGEGALARILERLGEKA